MTGNTPPGWSQAAYDEAQEAGFEPDTMVKIDCPADGCEGGYIEYAITAGPIHIKWDYRPCELCGGLGWAWEEKDDA